MATFCNYIKLLPRFMLSHTTLCSLCRWSMLLIIVFFPIRYCIISMITALGVVGENGYRIAWVSLLSPRSLATLLSNITASMENSFYRLKFFLCDCVYPKPSGLRNFPILLLDTTSLHMGSAYLQQSSVVKRFKVAKSGAKLV